jgi:hypothetical protein
MTRGRIIIAGSLAQRPRVGGHTWVFLQYVLGFRRLGWDVLFLDRLEPEMCRDASGRPCPLDRSVNLHYFQEVMGRFELGGAFALFYDRGERIIGLPREQVLQRVKDAAFLLNINGFLTDEEVLGRVPRRVFLDIDPGFGHMWQELGLHSLFRGHDDYVTIGENIGRADCAIPTCGLKWVTTPQPVVLDHWPPAPEPAGDSFTSIVTWRGAFGPVEYQGKTYGLRVHEFRKFAPLPRLSGRSFQLALDIHPTDAKDRALLTDNCWSLADPGVVAGNPWVYQDYIRGSRAEFVVAKNMYVQTGSGWLSDRSLCYLASGKPVLAQDTGFTRLYPTGAGLLAFRTLDEAAEGVEALCRDYARHARAARGLAEDYFASDKVLSRLLGKLSVA